MSTRLYFVASTAAPVTPAFDGSWQSNSGALRRSMSRSKAAATESRTNVAVASGAGNETLGFQLISEPLAAQTISTTGTMSLVSRGRELATQDNLNQRLRSIRVFSEDGNTLRGTLAAFGSGGGTTELSTTLSGQQHMVNGDVDADVVCSAGDRIVVEIGYGMNTTGTTPLYDMEIGGNGTDHANSNNDTTGSVPWVEFSQNLVFLVQGTATGSFGFTGSASGIPEKLGTATGSFGFTGSASGVILAAGPVHESASHETYTANGTSIAITPPSGVADEDIVVVRILQEHATASPPTHPALTDWAEPTDGFATVAQGDGVSISQTVLWHRAAGSETSDYTFTWTGNALATSTIHRISGCPTTGDPFEDSDSAASGAAGGTTPNVAVTTLGDDRLLLWFGAAYGGANNFTVPTDFTEVLNGQVNLGAGWKDQAAAGSSGNLSATHGNTDLKLAFAGALKPASAGGVVTGTATGSFGFTGAASGVRDVAGVATGSFGFTGSALGAPEKLGSASGAFTFTGSASGAPEKLGAASGVYTFSGTAAGIPEKLGVVTGSFGFTGQASGVREVAGQAQGAFTFSGTGSGLREVLGAGSGAFTFTGDASGQILGSVTGTATGTFSFTGAVSGVPTKLGVATGSFGFTGDASGVVTTTVEGEASGSYVFTGQAAGAPIRLGTAGAAFTFTGQASGVRETLGAALGAFVYTGSALGVILGPEVASTGPLRSGLVIVGGPSGTIGPDRAGAVSGGDREGAVR